MSSVEKEQKRITRREFVKGAAVGAVAAAGAGALAGCKKETPTLTPVPEPSVKTSAATPIPVPQKWDYEADVVVVGFGGAGGAAAIEAHDAGAKVLIVEKQPESTHYSNSRMSGGIFHCPDPTGDREALKQYLKAMMSGENLPQKLEGEQPDESDELAEMFAEYEVQICDFLKSVDPEIEFSGPFDPPPGFGGAAYSFFPGAEESKYQVYLTLYPKSGEADPDVPRWEQPKLYTRSGYALHACLLHGIQERGIDILYSSPAKRLVEKDGEIIGVIAEREGTEIACKAKKGVILTTGGYEYSVVQRRAFLEGPGVKGWAFYGTPDNRGDGIAMAIAVGAGLAKVGKAASRIITAVPYGRGYEETGLKMGLGTGSAARPNSVVVDNYGKRYAAEHLITLNPWRYQFYKMALLYDMLTVIYPRVPSWLVLDETMRTSRAVASGNQFVPWPADNLDAINRGWILKGDTIAELAAKIKSQPDNRNLMDAEALVETVENFNSYCAAGKDLEFARSLSSMGPVEVPPFYSVPLYPGGPNTKGGIMADGQRHVLTWAGKPILRLYTAGEISSVFKFVYQGGGNITECLVCGRIAGKNAAAETSWE